MRDWEEIIAGWRLQFRCRTLPPVEPTILAHAELEIGPLPLDLRTFYQHCNGLASVWFRVLPIVNPLDIKNTWDGLQRANDPTKTSFLESDQELLRRFLVFAALDAGRCAVYDRSDGTLWYEEDGLNQTTLNLVTFIEACLREVREF